MANLVRYWEVSDFWAIPKPIRANNPILRANPLFTLIINYTPKSRFVQILFYPSGMESEKCRPDSLSTVIASPCEIKDNAYERMERKVYSPQNNVRPTAIPYFTGLSSFQSLYALHLMSHTLHPRYAWRRYAPRND